MEEWLVGYFTVLGIQFQYWMPMALLMALAAVTIAVAARPK
jgi:hypothetical protein